MQHKKKIVLFLIGLISIFGIYYFYFHKKRIDDLVSHGESRSYDLQQVLQSDNVLPVVVIGSGPAGLSAALYIARAGIKVFTFAGSMPCGQLTQTTYVENWPGRQHVLGMNLMDDIKEQAQSCGAMIIHDSITKIDFDSWPFALQSEDGHKFKAMAIIVATGATPKILNIPGESEYWGKGVTTCAVCDAFFFKGKDIVIVGGGDSAIEMVFESAPHVRNVTVLVRKGSMRANQTGQKKMSSYSNVTVQYHKEITRIYGDGEAVTAIDVYDNQTKTTERRAMDGVFLAVGHTPNNQLLQSGIALDEQGYLQMQGRTQESSILGVFAAGEIQDPYYRQAIVAAGEGAKAALDAAEFLYEIGFGPTLGAQLNQNFFENFSEVRMPIKEINNEKELNEHVLQDSGLIILDFYAEDCPGCMKMLPILEAVASKLEGKAKFFKANMSKIKQTVYKALWFNYKVQVRSIPAMAIFKNGQFLEVSTRIFTKRELMEYLQKFL